MLTTAHIEALRGPVLTCLINPAGEKAQIEPEELLQEIAIGETVTVRQIKSRVEISEHFLADCLKELVKKKRLSKTERYFAGAFRHFYKRLK